MAKIHKGQVTSDVMLWKWSTDTNGNHPLKLRVTYQRKKKYYPIVHDNKNVFVNDKDWLKIQDTAEQVRGINKALRLTISTFQVNAENAIKACTQHGKPFTFERFESKMFSDESTLGFIQIFERHINQIRKEGRTGTYLAYNNALQAFKKFRNDKEVAPIDLTISMLKEFETYLLTKNNVKANKEDGTKSISKTTVAMYLRTLRLIYNVCVSLTPSLVEFYPFSTSRADKNKFRIKEGSGRKGEALTEEELKKLISIECHDGSPQNFARAIFMFSFYAQGMNYRDIALLRKTDLTSEYFTYVRSKTKNSEGREEKMQIPFFPEMQLIIDEFGAKSGIYVFPIIKVAGLTNAKLDAIIRQGIKTTNKWLKHLCESNDLPSVTTYWARHSYASILKMNGTPNEMSRELLGHSDLRTTEVYMTRFDFDQKKEVNAKVFDLIKK